jgi:hypothetical protein
MEQLYVSFDENVQALLSDNQIDLVKELRAQGLEVEATRAADPASAGDSKERDVVLVILASAAAFAAVSFGISRIIDALGRNKRVVVEERELVPVVDATGRAVLGAGGEPTVYWRTKQRMIEPNSPQPETSTISASAGGKFGVKFSLESGGRN